MTEPEPIKQQRVADPVVAAIPLMVLVLLMTMSLVSLFWHLPYITGPVSTPSADGSPDSHQGDSLIYPAGYKAGGSWEAGAQADAGAAAPATAATTTASAAFGGAEAAAGAGGCADVGTGDARTSASQVASASNSRGLAQLTLPSSAHGPPMGLSLMLNSPNKVKPGVAGTFAPTHGLALRPGPTDGPPAASAFGSVVLSSNGGDIILGGNTSNAGAHGPEGLTPSEGQLHAALVCGPHTSHQQSGSGGGAGPVAEGVEAWGVTEGPSGPAAAATVTLGRGRGAGSAPEGRSSGTNSAAAAAAAGAGATGSAAAHGNSQPLYGGPVAASVLGGVARNPQHVPPHGSADQLLLQHQASQGAQGLSVSASHMDRPSRGMQQGLGGQGGEGGRQCRPNTAPFLSSGLPSTANDSMTSGVTGQGPYSAFHTPRMPYSTALGQGQGQGQQGRGQGGTHRRPRRRLSLLQLQLAQGPKKEGWEVKFDNIVVAAGHSAIRHWMLARFGGRDPGDPHPTASGIGRLSRRSQQGQGQAPAAAAGAAGLERTNSKAAAVAGGGLTAVMASQPSNPATTYKALVTVNGTQEPRQPVSSQAALNPTSPAFTNNLDQPMQDGNGYAQSGAVKAAGPSSHLAAFSNQGQGHMRSPRSSAHQMRVVAEGVHATATQGVSPAGLATADADPSHSAPLPNRSSNQGPVHGSTLQGHFSLVSQPSDVSAVAAAAAGAAGAGEQNWIPPSPRAHSTAHSLASLAFVEAEERAAARYGKVGILTDSGVCMGSSARCSLHRSCLTCLCVHVRIGTLYATWPTGPPCHTHPLQNLRT